MQILLLIWDLISAKIETGERTVFIKDTQRTLLRIKVDCISFWSFFLLYDHVFNLKHLKLKKSLEESEGQMKNTYRGMSLTFREMKDSELSEIAKILL